jgi:tetratricopeptide (TPR) repeat protein
MGSVDPELHLHLGRVSGLLGDHEAAIASLTRASEGLKEPALQYDAALFLAAEYEALERWDDSRVSLLRAAALFPKAQSALVALSRLRHRQGDNPGTVAPLELMFGLRGADPRRDDPWWNYTGSHARNSTALLVQARQRLRGGGS